MTGAQVKITVDDKAVRLAFMKLGDGRWATAALKQIGEKLLKSTKARFHAEQDPTGKACVAINRQRPIADVVGLSGEW